MAKKPRSHKRNGEEVAAEAARPSISRESLRRLLRMARESAEDVGALVEPVKEAVGDAVKNEFLNRWAFNVVKALDKLEPEVLADRLFFLDLYLEQAGLRGRAGKVMRLDLDGGEPHGEPGQAEAEAEDDGKVVPLPQQAAG
jgi:hypothetical protein